MTDVRPGRGRRMLLRLAIVVVFNIGCALTITYLLKMGGSFIVNLVFSFCIGTLAWLFIDGGRMLIWGEDKPAGLPFLAMTMLALPLAQMGGSALAAWLLGMPAHPVLATESSHAASILLFSVLAGLKKEPRTRSPTATTSSSVNSSRLDGSNSELMASKSMTISRA